MDILISIATKIAEYTMAPIGRQVGYLMFYKDNFNKLEGNVQALEDLRDQIKHSIEVERRNGKEIEVVVKNWLHRADGIIEEAKQLCKDPCHANVGCSKWSFPNMRSRHQLSRNANKMATNIVEVQGKGKFDHVGFLPPLDGVGFTSAARGIENLKSRELMKKKIVLALRDPKLNKIGVFGLGGVGKTTIAKEVAKQVKDDKLFDEAVLAVVSENPDIERIQNEIADLLGLHFEEKSLVGRASRLCERIKQEKTILIVLDNVLARLDLEKIGIPSEDDHKGCKLLLTSRNCDALQNMDTEKDFRLEVLNEEETWSLFEAMAGDIVKDVSLQDIATQVAKKCAGLPVLIVTVARALKNKDSYYWRNALNQLQRVDKGELKEIVYSALEFSFSQMESNEMKEIFLLCGVHGTSIGVRDLLKYGIGLGIFKHISTVDDARNRLDIIISELRASCLFLEDDSTAQVKMHDIVSEVAISIASRDQYVFTMKMNTPLIDWPTQDFFKRCTKVVLLRCRIQKLPERLDCPNLKYLCISSSDNRFLKISHFFFEGMGNLEVLDLTGMNIFSLPISFGSLTKLKTLCLDHCALGDMAGIGALKNLEILGINHSSMEKLPSEIGQLIQLRMLDLSNSGIDVIPPHVLSNLTKLEELYMGNISIKWEVENMAKPSRNATLAELRHLTNLIALEIQIQEVWILPRDIMFEKLERYKIVIGDVWEWSNTNRVSKTLKIKLGTDIHLEHGIKTLIKRVEDLHLDELNGISSVLYQLNGEGFPLLKHLYIQNNAEIQHIIDSMERNITHIFFPKLETLELYNLTRLEKICHGRLTDNSFGKLRAIKVRSCGELEYLLSVPMVKALSQLLDIEVSECNSMKMIVFSESMNSGTTTDKIEFCSLRSLTLHHLPTIDSFCSNELMSSKTTKQSLLSNNIPMSYFNAEVSFSSLQTLKLSSINMNKIWNDDEASTAYSIRNLTNIIVEDCGGLKYLFSSSMVENLSNLKQIQISRCHEMEEIIATKGTNDAPLEEVRFTKLDTITINDMQKLKTVWHYQFDGLKTLEVTKCEKLENIFPSYMHGAFGCLETLKVTDCRSMEEIFQLSSEMCSAEDTTQLKQLTLHRLPKLKRIWSRDPQNILRCPNLRVVYVEQCESLEYLFPFSIAMDMLQLEEITIKWAKRMKEIVSKKEGAMDSPVIFELNHLTSFVLWNSCELGGFFAGEHSLACPSLRALYVFNCPKLKLFKTRYTSSQGRIFANKHRVSMHQPLFTLEKVICNLEDLTITNEDASIILQSQISGDHFRKLELLRVYKFKDDQATFPYWFLQSISSLKELVVEWSSFKEIFRDDKGQIETRTRLKELALHQLHELKYICKEGAHIDPVLEVLEYLTVIQCSNLKNLVASCVTFSHLTYLKIEKCDGLIHLISSLTARSLVKLTTMIVRECNSLEQILIEEEEAETKDEIAFNSLAILQLECLPKLNKFSSCKTFLKFPLLEKVVVQNCPSMETFSVRNTSTPMLQKIHAEERDKKWYWEGNLNKTIKKMFLDKVAFRNFKYLELSEYPELKDIWYGQVQQKIFCNLKHLVVQKCDFLSNVLLPANLLRVLYNLEELEVRNCDSLEAVFDLTNMNGKEMLVEETFQLKKITLSGLPELKHVWIQNFQEIVNFDNSKKVHCEKFRDLKMSEIQSFREIQEDEVDIQQHPLYLADQNILRFQNLQFVYVEECDNLEYLFPFSISMDMPQIEEISIKEAGSMKEIVSIKEGAMDSPVLFEFNHLTSLVLWNLHELRGFYAEDHSLACHSLSELDVSNCSKLKLFKTKCTSSRLHISMHQPLFTLEEVICNLENLRINREDASMILQGQYSGDHFCKLKFLCVSKFEGDQATFPYWFFQNMSNLNWLVVEWSSFKEIFRDERPIDEIRTLLRKLSLYQLHELQYICKGSQVDPVLEVLEHLYVDQCSNLKHLVPSSITFSHLTYLEVQNCNGLIYLITSSVARSLVKLTTMKIKKCNSLEQIVAEEGEETNDEIAFNILEILELECLPKLNRFSSCKCFFKFLLLEKVVVSQCPRMKTFSIRDTETPKLHKILTDQNDELWCWEGDINNTIRKMFLDLLAFRSFERLELFEYPELKEVWYGQVRETQEDDVVDMQLEHPLYLADKVGLDCFKHLKSHENRNMKELWYEQVGTKTFCNLKSLVVHKCDFLTNVLFPSNLLQVLCCTLEELEVSDCDSLEVLFDVNIMDGREMHLKETSQLKKITVFNLPNLKHIWSEDSLQILSFGKLQHIRVTGCPNLINLFSVSMCQDLGQLEKLDIESCGVEEIVAIEEGSEELNFHFAQLTILRLVSLTKLKSFYRENHTLECPSLKTLNVFLCEALQIFSFDHLDSQQTIEVGEADLPIHQALFYVEKVSLNLTDLSLNEKDAMRILNGHCEKNLFTGIEILYLQYFQETPVTFLDDLLENFPNTTTLLVRYSSFDTLFPSDEIGQCSNEGPTQINSLWLFELKQLKNIWNDDSLSNPIAEILEDLSVWVCPSLMRLAPPSISFKNLTNLEVKDCKGLIYLMTSSTAKSLVHLESLKIKNCEMIEDVVRIDEGESEEEMVFESLEDLRLTSLLSFKSFCSGNLTFVFPSLVQLKVRGCPKMQNFSSGVTLAPFLKTVEVENGKMRWKEDLNTTIQQLFMEKEIPESNKS